MSSAGSYSWSPGSAGRRSLVAVDSSTEPDERWRDRYPVPFVYLIVIGIPVALFALVFLYLFLTIDLSGIN